MTREQQQTKWMGGIAVAILGLLLTTTFGQGLGWVIGNLLLGMTSFCKCLKWGAFDD